jgi:N-carbamoyl-L-amino-acid hydrolase
MGRAGSRAARTARLLLLVAATTCAQQPFESRTAPTAGPATALHVNAARLRQTLEKLSEFGRPAGGTFADGVTRLGFSEADLAAREYVSGLMREAGLDVRVDPAGNLFGRRAGSANLPVILFGSHIDSVPRGGHFDGNVGSLGAIEVIRAMNEHGVRTRHPLEVVVWTNEEGHHFGKGLFGSSAAAGLLAPEVLERRDEQGLSVADWLRRYGQDPARFLEARLPPGYFAAYLELHIEQGGVLEREKTPIGVVEGIVGIHWYTCQARGFANHAGTTPMDQRRDALAAAAKAVLAVREEVRREAGRQVGTVGYLKVEPGARNIIPGQVEFPVELRDLDAEKIERIWTRIQQRFQQIEREEGVQIQCELLSRDRPALTDPYIRQQIRQAADSAGLAFLDLPSGAGHDAQQMARLGPIGMIFVPSRGGISHSPLEFSDWEDIARGAEVLYRTILLLDRNPPPR